MPDQLFLPSFRNLRLARMRFFLLALMALWLMAETHAQSNTWDSLLTGSKWFVPAENLLAYLTAPTTFADPQETADQTLWSLGDSVNGVFTGTSVASFKLGPITITGTNAMNGVVTDSGQIRIIFSTEGSAPVVGIGQVEEIAGTTYLQMQMITDSGGFFLTHWAYMAEYDGDPGSLPPLEIESSFRSEEWNWMLGTSWDLASPDLFGLGEIGTFLVDGYRNGYFWGSGSGPLGSAAESFTLLGSATPEGTVLFNILSDGVLTSLTGQITGDASNGQMALRTYDPATGPGEAGFASVVPEPSVLSLILVCLGGLLMRTFWRQGYCRNARTR